jgi:hypothetical protein
MAEAAKSNDKSPRDRSPSFPFIPLRTAVERLDAFEKKFGRHPTPISKAGLAWGLKEKSSQADSILAALKSFGLLKYEGMGSTRHAAITDDGRNYLRAEQESVKQEILKACALRPKTIRKFWAKWSADRPADEVAIDKLVLENSFSEAGARNFLKVYDDTIAYAKLSDSDKATLVEGESEEESEQSGMTPQPHTPPKPGIVTPPPPPAPKKLGHQHAAFPLPEGDVSLSFPAEMSVASAQMMASFVKLLLEQAERQAKVREEAYQAGVAQMAASGQKPSRTIIGGAGEEDE